MTENTNSVRIKTASLLSRFATTHDARAVVEAAREWVAYMDSQAETANAKR